MGMAGANYAQRDYGKAYDRRGRLQGWEIKDVVEALNNKKLMPADVVIDFVQRDGHWLIRNTRSSQALEQANIPREQWYVRDMTGDPDTEYRLNRQLKRSDLTSEGIPMVAPRDE